MAERPLHSLIPDPDNVLSLEPEELGSPVLAFMASTELEHFSRSAILESAARDYPERYRDAIQKAVMEAWVWLVREGLIAEMPGYIESWFITRRGKRLVRDADFVAYHKGNLLPRRLLHPVLEPKVWGAFLRGDYDVAVFQAFKEVEVAVRAAGKFAATDLGTDLMRKAFRPDTGPLTDVAEVKSEQQALGDLFAGAVGRFKNPGSHRPVTMGAEEAVELLLLASHLMKIVDARV